ncbi:MAG TPA: STAS domain-containing protein [Solirubrobacterales bacterium]|nr:STAS domain-containing protein [Solirubrobacterales bacterium]
MPDQPQDASPSRLFEIETSRGDAMTIALSGELDLAAVDQLNDAVVDAEQSTTGWIVIDLAELSFMDSTILNVLLEARKRASENGQRLRFVRSKHDQVNQVLSITGTSELFS